MPKESLPSNLNPSPNLLDEAYTKPNTGRKLLNVVKILAIAPFVLYILLLTINYTLSPQIKKLQAYIQKLESTAYLLKPIEKETRSIILKTDLYKNYLANRQSIQSKAGGFMNQIPPTVRLKRMVLDNTGLSAVVESGSSIDVSIFINNYLKDKAVKNIELLSFTYDGFSKTFEAEFKIHYVKN